MARILILAMVAVLLFGGVLAADLALQNPDTAVDTNNSTQQDTFVEATGPMLDAAPVLLVFLLVGSILAAIGRVG